ncbi:MAG: hypothetical protein GXP26_17795 [Planctomycetes bacterium]|nr:hypothetical protein [Planctomycetota bacterium]
MFATIPRSRLLRHRWCGCLALCFVVALAQPASAQQYKTIPPKITGGAAKQLRTKAKSAFRDAASYQANKQAIDQYYGQFYFPLMTAHAPESLGRLGKARDSLLREIRGAKVPAAQKQVTELTQKAMHSISRADCHPAVRYNAVLILGALDEKQETRLAPPVPLSAATKSLIELIETDSFKDVKVPASLKLGAWVGLERHAHCGVAQEHAGKLTQAALKLIAQEEPPTDVALEVHHWMKCQAARVLTRQHAKKANPQVHAAMTKMINDDNMNFEDRCCIASLLARVSYQGSEGIDGAATVTALGNLMKQVVSDEARLALEYEEIKMGRGGGISRNRLIEPVFQRARLASRLKSIGRGGMSLKAGLPDAGKAQITSLLTPLAPVLAAAADKKNVDLNVTEAVKNLEGKINSVVDSWKKPGEAEKAEDDFS